jgi:hypothetical protein
VSKTADTTTWNQKSDYHALRAHAAKEQVDSVLYPAFIQTIRDDVSHNYCRVADFACGGGSIARAFLEACIENGADIDEFVLIDVVQDNLTAARSLLKDSFPEINISAFLCNGKNFADYTGRKVNFLYCWDAMVHFDILDVAGYIQSLNNVVSGVAFLHHSNYAHVTSAISENPHCRNFMSKDIFRQLCLSAGHKVVEQQLMAWGEPDLDCLTTIRVD